MNIVETLQRYKEVATFLTDDANGAVLDHLIACMEGKQYYFPSSVNSVQENLNSSID